MSTDNFSTPRNPRQNRGLHLAQDLPIRHSKQGWLVPSQSGRGKYTVALDMSGCTCPDFENRGGNCKHIEAVEYMLDSIEDADQIEAVAPVPPKVTYR